MAHVVSRAAEPLTYTALRNMYRRVLNRAMFLPVIAPPGPNAFRVRPTSIAFSLMGASDSLGYDIDRAADSALWAITYWFNVPGPLGASRRGAITNVYLLYPSNKRYKPERVKLAWQKAME